MAIAWLKTSSAHHVVASCIREGLDVVAALCSMLKRSAGESHLRVNAISFAAYLKTSLQLLREHDTDESLRYVVNSHLVLTAIDRRTLHNCLPDGRICRHVRLSNDFVYCAPAMDYRRYYQNPSETALSQLTPLPGCAMFRLSFSG